MLILVDLDGVVVDMLPTWLNLINRYYGENLRVSDITAWGVHGFCKKASSRQVHQLIKEPGFFRHLPPVRGAIETLKELKEAGHEIEIVTAASAGHSDKQAWVEKHLPFIDAFDDVHYTRKKYRICGDLFIDDHEKNLRQYRDVHGGDKVVCFDQLYNRDYDGMRVLDWEEVPPLIEKIFG